MRGGAFGSSIGDGIEMDTDRRPASSAISHRRAALLASSALVRVGLAVATVSGTLALMAFAGSVPAVAAGGSRGSGGGGGSPDGGAGGAEGVNSRSPELSAAPLAPTSS